MNSEQITSNYHIVAISAGKPGGKTEQLLVEALRAARSAGSVDTELIRLCESDILPCRGCNACQRQQREHTGEGFCVIPDDFREVFRKIERADAILFGTPDDHCFPPAAAIRLMHRTFGLPRAYGAQCWSRRKYGAVIAVSSARPAGYLIPIGVYMLNRFHKGILMADTVTIQLDSNDTKIPQDLLERAARTGERIAEALRTGEVHPEPSVIYYHQPDNRYQISPCPGCGNGIVKFTAPDHFACGACNSQGDLVVRNGRIFLQWDPESVRVNTLSYEGEVIHLKNIDGNNKLKAPVRPEEEVRAALVPLMKEDLAVKPDTAAAARSDRSVKRILGISAGRIVGNTETILRAALLEAEKASPRIQTELICLRDLNLSDPVNIEESAQDNLHKDDFQWILDRMKDADAIILGAPAYCLLGPAEMMCLLQRCARLSETDAQSTEKEPPVAAIFSVSGGPRHTYVWDAESILLRSVHPGIQLTERQEFLYISEKAQIVFDEEKMGRARRMGRQIADTLLGSVSDPEKYISGNTDSCPCCGSVNKELHQDGSFCCPVCGTTGCLSAEAGKPELIWNSSE